MTTVLAILTAVSGLLAVFFKAKANSANALLDNQKATESLNKVDQSLSKNQGLLEAEEAKRQELSKQGVKDVSKEDLVDFINNHHSPK